MLDTKDPRAFLAPFAGQARALRGVAIGGHASLSAEAAAAAARAVGIAGVPAPSVAAALADIVGRDPAPARVLVCGSLYLAGQVLAENG